MDAPSIEDLRQRRRPAWSWFVSEFAGPVRNYARHLGHPDPDEVSGATIEVVVKRIDQFDGGQPELRSFVFSVAHARIVDEFRSSHRRRVIPVPEVPEVPYEEEDFLPAVLSDDLSSALSQLTVKQRRLLVLRYVDGASTRETAHVVGESEGATRVALSRSLKSLRQHLDDGEKPCVGERLLDQVARQVGGIQVQPQY